MRLLRRRRKPGPAAQPDTSRCAAITRRGRGSRCKLPATYGGVLCSLHGR